MRVRPTGLAVRVLAVLFVLLAAAALLPPRAGCACDAPPSALGTALGAALAHAGGALPPASAADKRPQSFQELLAEASASTDAQLLAVMESVSFAAEQAVPQGQRGSLFSGMGQIYQVPEEVAFYTAAARLPGVKNVCEVGFNAGHSGAVFLMANSETVYYAFDTMGLQWSTASLAFMERVFPGRVHMSRGLSTDTLPKHTWPLCDLLSIDGEHAGETPFLDIVNGKKASRAGGYVLMDDWSSTSPDVKTAWARAKQEGVLEEVLCQDLGIYVTQYHKAWCLGQYL